MASGQCIQFAHSSLQMVPSEVDVDRRLKIGGRDTTNFNLGGQQTIFMIAKRVAKMHMLMMVPWCHQFPLAMIYQWLSIPLTCTGLYTCTVMCIYVRYICMCSHINYMLAHVVHNVHEDILVACKLMDRIRCIIACTQPTTVLGDPLSRTYVSIPRALVMATYNSFNR